MIPNVLEPWTDQRTPALAIVARGDQIVDLGPLEFRVRSQSRPTVLYAVRVFRERWACTCAFFHAWHRRCIHILAVRLRNGFRDRGGPDRPSPPCPRCRSGDAVHYGSRMTRTGNCPRFLCRSCGRRFTNEDGFLRTRNDPEKIAISLDLYYRGLSVRKVADHLAQVHELKVSASTVYAWVVRYSRLAARWMDTLRARTGPRWQIDETVVSSAGKVWYIWNVLDADSRFLLATHISRGRGVKDARVPISRAQRATPDRPSEVLTDGLATYPKAVGKQLGYRSHQRWYTFINPHRRVPSIRAKVSNNRIERLHGTEKERLKVMRGLEGGRASAALIEGFRVHYNMVRDHAAIGTTPGGAAGLPDMGTFRWRGVLREATSPRPPPKSSDPVELVFLVERRGPRAARRGPIEPGGSEPAGRGTARTSDPSPAP